MSSTGGNVDLTFQNEIRAPATVGGTVVVPLEGRTESRPWTVELLDNSNAVHSNLSDSSGRLDLIGRLCDYQTNTSSGGWTTIAAGRLSVVEVTQDETFLVSIEDERMLERRATIFTSQNTSQVWPPGLAQQWGNLRAEPTGRGLPMVKQNNLLLIRMDLQDQSDGLILPPGVIDAIVADEVPNRSHAPTATAGNFTNLRLYHNSTAFEIFGFDVEGETELSPRVAASILNRFGAARIQGTQTHFQVWIVDSSGKLGTPSGSRSDDWIDGLSIRMDGSEPSEGVPLHIASSADRSLGLQPFALLKKIYDGDYGGSTIRYSTAAMDTMTGIGHFGRGFWRITKPQNMAEWVEEHIYKPYGAVPLIGDNGAVVPTALYLPAATDISTGTLFALTSTNLANLATPTWTHSAQDARTVVRGHYDIRLQRSPRDAAVEGLRSADRISVTSLTHEETHDRTTAIGQFVHDITLDGVAMGHPRNPTVTAPNLTKFLAREIFERYGDGPVMGAFPALDSASTVAVGDFAKMQLDTFPNPATTGRGGTRFIQITGKTYAPTGPVFDYLDLGPNNGALTAPGFSVGLSTSSPKHEVTFNVTSGIPTGGSWQASYALTLKTTAAFTAPGSTSAAWTVGPSSDTTSSTHVLTDLPSNHYVSVRVRSVAPNRIRSDWSTVASTATSAIAAPTAISVGQVKTRTAVVSFTVGSSAYPLALHADGTSTAAVSSSNFLFTLPTNSTTVLIQGLTANAGQMVGVRHADPFGGYSAADSTTLTTLSTASTNYAQAPSLRGVSVLTVGT